MHEPFPSSYLGCSSPKRTHFPSSRRSPQALKAGPASLGPCAVYRLSMMRLPGNAPGEPESIDTCGSSSRYARGWLSRAHLCTKWLAHGSACEALDFDKNHRICAVSTTEVSNLGRLFVPLVCRLEARCDLSGAGC